MRDGHTRLGAALAIALFGLLTLTTVTPAHAAEAPGAAKAGRMAHGDGGMMHDMTIRLSIADGAVLMKPPTSIRFDFAPAMRLRSAVLTNAAGERIPVTFESRTPAANVTVAFAALEPDAYTLAFSVDAGDHDMPGRIRFSVR